LLVSLECVEGFQHCTEQALCRCRVFAGFAERFDDLSLPGDPASSLLDMPQRLRGFLSGLHRYQTISALNIAAAMLPSVST